MTNFKEFCVSRGLFNLVLKEEIMKEMTKRILKVVLPLFIIVGIIGGAYIYTKPATVEGQKTIEIHFFDGRVEEGEDKIELATIEWELIDEDNALFLGDAIDLINVGDENFIVFFLSEPSEYGRMVEGIEVGAIYSNTDTTFWVIDSENNVQCIEDGFCSGIDSQAIFDGDIFEFTYEIPEW